MSFKKVHDDQPKDFKFSDENLKKVVYEPVTLKQEFRDFDNESPWEGMKETIKEELEKK